ncbi:MAG: DNA mismatch endonuclease Vsr [Alphaproteobacteria bacterium]|nr:DNA mismatch endonuclease Vsr [Alphaproteobacteria bacterium]
MRRIRRTGTSPELATRRWLWRHGIRYTTKNRNLPGSPDIANRARRWAVFVHGCFWHGHGGCKYATLPKRNSQFWSAKIADNRRRDAKKRRMLEDLGYEVIEVWECELRSIDNPKLRTRFTRLLPRRAEQ